MRGRPFDQGVDDDPLLHRIVGLCDLLQEQPSRVSVGGSVAKKYWKERCELGSGIVTVHLVLRESQAQKEVGTLFETVGMEGNLFQCPYKMPTNIAPNHIQIRELPKRTLNSFSHEGSINLSQGRENLRVA